GWIPATRFDLDRWMKMLPQPWSAAMEATMFSGWIYDHLKPHALPVKSFPVPQVLSGRMKWPVLSNKPKPRTRRKIRTRRTALLVTLCMAFEGMVVAEGTDFPLLPSPIQSAQALR
ncbi:MAG: hypothetical protein WAM58_04600, partial [Candidatus Acidiferrum sp.]